nr:MAG TPA: hypothetical protein [Caudoviricetes sp.]
MTQALTINDVWIKPGRITLGTYGSVGVDRLALVFSPEWEGLLAKATFYPVYGSPVEMLANREIVVPPEMYKQSGVGKLVISGYAVDNNVLKKRKYTLPCEMEIPNTIVRKGENSIPETPNVYEQLRAQMQDDITNALQAAKDSGAFDGADGAAATVAVSRTVTLPSGSDASVSNEGTDTNARLVFGIPRGAKGDSGERGGSGVYVLADGETESDIPADAEVALFPSGEDLHILDGRGIVSITRTTGNGAAGSTDIYTIAYSDNTTSAFTVYNGKDGAGFKPLGFKNSASDLPATANPGEAYFVGTASPYDVYVWSGTEWKNIGAINGIKGDDGRGIVSIIRTSGNGTAGSTDTYTITYSDSTTSTFPVYNGKDGATGEKGDAGATGAKGADGRGIVSITRTSGNGAAGTVDTYTITYSDATTSTFPVRNGADGTAAGITIDGTVTSTGTNAVSGKAVYDHVLGVMGDFNTVASQMETLIGG